MCANLVRSKRSTRIPYNGIAGVLTAETGLFAAHASRLEAMASGCVVELHHHPLGEAHSFWLDCWAVSRLTELAEAKR